MINGIGYFQQNLLMKDKRNVYYFIDLLYSDDENEGTMITFFSRTFSKTPLENNVGEYTCDEVYFEDIQKWFDTLTLVSSGICFDEDTCSHALFNEAKEKYKNLNKFAYVIENMPLPSLSSDNKILKDLKDSILKLVGIEKDGYLRQDL